MVTFPHGRGKQRGGHARECAAPAQFGLRMRQRGAEHLLGKPDLPLPEVAQADDQPAPLLGLTQSRLGRCGQRLLLRQAGERRLAVEQRAQRRPVGVHLHHDRVAQRRMSRPRIVQRGETIGVVGEHGGGAEDQRALAAQRVVAAGACQQTLDECAGLEVAVGGGERPGSGQQQLRAPLEFVGRQPGEPVEHGLLPPMTDQRLVHAALGQLEGPVALAGRQRVLGRSVDQPRLGEPVRRAGVQRRALLNRQRGEALAQRVAHHGVHVQPLAVLAGDEDRRVARQAGQTLVGVGGADDDAAQVRVQRVEHRNAQQDVEVGGGQPADGERDDTAAQVVVGRRGHGHRRTLGRCAQRQLHAERPALAHLVQPCRRIGVEARTEPLARQRQRLVEREAQRRGADPPALPVVDEVRHAEVHLGAGGDDDAQVRRRVVQHVGERRASGVGQAFGLVDDQHDVARQVHDLAQPDGHRLEGVLRRGVEQRAAESRPHRGAAHGVHERLHQA